MSQGRVVIEEDKLESQTIKIKSDAEKDFSFELFPNPANDMITFNCGQLDANLIVKIYNAVGELIIERPILEKSTHFQTTHLNNGIYIFNLINHTGEVLYKDKVVIVH